MTAMKKRNAPAWWELHKKYFIGCLLVCLALEVFVFNLNAFAPAGKAYAEQALPFENAKIEGFTENADGTLSLSDKQVGWLTFSAVNSRVGTLYVDMDLGGTLAEKTVQVDFSDETNADLRCGSASVSVLRDNERSKTAVCQFSGEVGALRLRIQTEDGESLLLKGVHINRPVGFHFSAFRFMTIFSLAILVYLLFRAKTLEKPFGAASETGTQILTVGTAVFAALAILAVVPYAAGHPSSVSFTSHTGNQITKELVDAFLAGQVQLLEKPSEELLALSNPYDWSLRQASGVSYLWDHCLYNGAYYSYYGIAPVLLLFLPYRLLTGYYFPTAIAVVLFAVVGICFLSAVYLQIIRKWFKNLPLRFVLSGFLVLQAASGIWFSAARPLFYEIAIASGFAFVTAGAYFLLSSNVVGEGKISLSRTAASSVCLSLAVLCRPTLAVYCVAALFFLFFGFLKTKREKWKRLPYLVAALLPYAVFGSLQMAYNYLRFGSVLDFGIQYSLTINDFTKSEFHLQFVLVGLFGYLFAAPQLVPQFPFLSSSFQKLSLNGYYFVDDIYTNNIATGIVWRALPMLCYPLAGRAYRAAGKPKAAALLISVSCLAMPLVIICSVWESGYAVRYNADISWQMLLGALMIVFALIANCKNKGVLQIASAALCLSAVLALFVNFAQVYSFIVPNWTAPDLESTLLGAGRLFEFYR